MKNSSFEDRMSDFFLEVQETNGFSKKFESGVEQKKEEANQFAVNLKKQK